MVGVASSAILACLHPLLRSSLSLCSPIPSTLRTLPSLSVGQLAPYVRLPRVQDILVSPLCRVTFGLYARPNLPDRRPGPPFSTNPGDELRGSRGLLVAMETEPSSPNPRQPNTGFLSLGTHFPSPRFSLSLCLLLESFPPLRDSLFLPPLSLFLETGGSSFTNGGNSGPSSSTAVISDSSNSFLLASSSFDAVRFVCSSFSSLWFSLRNISHRRGRLFFVSFSLSLGNRWWFPLLWEK